MSFRYGVVNLNALACLPTAAELHPDLFEVNAKSRAMKEHLLDQIASGQVTAVIANGVEFQLVRTP